MKIWAFKIFFFIKQNLAVLLAQTTPELLAQTIFPILAVKYLGPKTPNTGLGYLFYQSTEELCVSYSMQYLVQI